MQTTPNLGLVLPSGDGDPFDELPFSTALVKVDGVVAARIADQVVGRGQSGDPAVGATAFDFLNIPQTYAHLMLVLGNLRSNRAAAPDEINLRINGDATAQYDAFTSYCTSTGTYAQGSGPNQNAFALTLTTTPSAALAAGICTAWVIDIPAYNVAALRKTILSRGNGYDLTANSPYRLWGECLWSGTQAAVTRLTLALNASGWASGRATLYGLP